MDRPPGPPKLDPALVQRIAAQRRDVSLTGEVRAAGDAVVRGLLGLLLPHFAVAARSDHAAIQREWHRRRLDLEALIRDVQGCCTRPVDEVLDAFAAALPVVADAVDEDAAALERADPAAESLDEVVVAYPGFLAVAVYRIAHALHGQGVRILPRLMAEYAHRETGIDLHPAARIGRRFVIDHGTGVVVGATTDIGDDVRLYQGVTLGALQVAKELAGAKRHPTLGDRVTVYSNATILGGATVVGDDTVVGGNVWLTESVPPGSVVTRRSEVRVRRPGDPVDAFDWAI